MDQSLHAECPAVEFLFGLESVVGYAGDSHGFIHGGSHMDVINLQTGFIQDYLPFFLEILAGKGEEMDHFVKNRQQVVSRRFLLEQILNFFDAANRSGNLIDRKSTRLNSS